MFSETTGTPGVLLFLAVMTLMIVLRRFFFKEDEDEDEDEDRRGRMALSLLGLATALALFAWHLWGGD